MRIIEIYTDGAAKGNPGQGGYGVVMLFNGHKKEISQGYRLTTNNRMELLAVIVALENIKSTQYPITITSDSKYVVDAINKKWIDSWQKIDFAGKKNKDLWIRFIEASKRLQIEVKWIKGHRGHVHNERCDYLATQAAQSKHLLIDEQYENQ